MATHNMVALVPMRYGGRQLKAGDAFTAEGMHAKLLVAIKKAKLDDVPAEELKPAAKPATKAATPAPAKPAAKAATTEPAAVSTAVPGMTTKSTYKTRDLDPE